MLLFIWLFYSWGLLPSSAAAATAEMQAGRVEPVPIEASTQARYPHFVQDEQRILVAWVEKQKSGGTLFFAPWDAKQKRFGKAVAGPSRTGMFVNWADYPKLQIGKDFWLWVWPETISDKHKYAYGLRFARSFDQGRTWSDPQWLHDDQSPTEHGFVSLQPLPDGGFAVIWLDGRAMKPQSEGDHDGHHGGGGMQLRFREVGAKTLGPEQLWDDRTCECCGTALTRQKDGSLLAAYRNRSDEEFRDIHLIRYKAGRAEKITPSFNEQWKIHGCPVNGPALACTNKTTAVAWFTGADKGAVAMALTQDSGTSWSKSLTNQTPHGGRTALFATKIGYWMSWVQQSEEQSSIVVRQVRLPDDKARAADLPHFELPFDGSRSSGFPQIHALADTRLLIAHTNPKTGLKIFLSDKTGIKPQ